MAEAYKCDRCGKLYEKEGTPRRIIEITKDLHPYSEQRLQLCDECQNELENWLNTEDSGQYPINIVDSFGDQVSSCPNCKQPIVNVWNRRGYFPKYCHYCGQKFKWRSNTIDERN